MIFPFYLLPPLPAILLLSPHLSLFHTLEKIQQNADNSPLPALQKLLNSLPGDSVAVLEAILKLIRHVLQHEDSNRLTCTLADALSSSLSSSFLPVLIAELLSPSGSSVLDPFLSLILVYVTALFLR